VKGSKNAAHQTDKRRSKTMEEGSAVEKAAGAAGGTAQEVVTTAQVWIDKVVDWAVSPDGGLIVAWALILLIVGWQVVNLLVGFAHRAMEKGKVEVSLITFLDTLLRWTLRILLVTALAPMVGIEVMGFAAILAGAGLAVGLALQGSLANFAGGVLILVFKPFKVGHLIQTQGFLGVVKEIQVFCTILTTPDGKTIILPNGPVSNGNVTNLSMLPTKRVDISVGISYGDDIAKARQVALDTIAAEERALKDPAPQVLVKELGDNSVNFTVRVWGNSEHYWDLFFGLTEKIKIAFDQNGITIPFPQRDVHLHQTS